MATLVRMKTHGSASVIAALRQSRHQSGGCLIVAKAPVRFPETAAAVKQDEYSSVLISADAVNSPALRRQQARTAAHDRLGLVINRKLAKRAVRGTIMKRVIRAAFANNSNSWRAAGRSGLARSACFGRRRRPSCQTNVCLK